MKSLTEIFKVLPGVIFVGNPAELLKKFLEKITVEGTFEEIPRRAGERSENIHRRIS